MGPEVRTRRKNVVYRYGDAKEERKKKKDRRNVTMAVMVVTTEISLPPPPPSLCTHRNSPHVVAEVASAVCRTSGYSQIQLANLRALS